MGACFITGSFCGEKTQAEVKTAFYKAQVDDRFESGGNEYSGGFGSVPGLIFTGKEFSSHSDAEKYISNTAKKWEKALCVKFIDSKDRSHWLIGAWSST